MQSDLVALLGLKLDEVGKSSFVRSLSEQSQTELIEDRFYMNFQQSGVSIDADLDGRAASIFLYGSGHQDYHEYHGSLPDGVSYSDSRSDVHKKLGEPSASGGGGAVPLFGTVPTWDRYDRDAYSLHLQYGAGERSITLVTLMRPDAVPL